MKAFHKTAFVALGYILLYKPGFIVGMPVFSAVDRLFDILRIVLILYSLLIVFLRGARFNRLTGVVLLLLVTMLWEMFTTFYNNADLSSGVGANLNMLGILLFTYLCLTVDEYAFFKGCSLALGGYVIANLLTVLIFPGGMYNTTLYKANYFLSYRNAWFPILLIAFVVTLIWNEKDGRRFPKIWTGLVIGSGFVSMILVWTATGIFCFSLGAAFLIFWRCRGKRYPIKVIYVVLIELVIFVLIVFMGAQRKFAFIIVDLLHKDLTLSERLRIWSNAIISVRKHFWTGIGSHSVNIVRSILGWGASHAHNYYLNRLFFFGVIGLALSMVTLCYAGMGLYKSRIDLRSKYVVTAAVIVMTTAFQAESYASIGFYLYPLYLIMARLASKGKGFRHVDRIGNALPNQ